MDIFILKFRQKYTIKWYVCLFVSHNHTVFPGGICFVFLFLLLKRPCLHLDKIFLLKKRCSKILFSVPCKLMILQLGSLFKKQSMYFINYFFTYAKSLSTNVIFTNALLLHSFWNILRWIYNQFGLKNKSQLTERFEICTPVKPSNQQLVKNILKLVCNLCVGDIL